MSVKICDVLEKFERSEEVCEDFFPNFSTFSETSREAF